MTIVTTGDAGHRMRLLMLQIVNALVDDPESVEIRCEEQDDETCFTIRVSGSDAGKIIGNQGRTVRSIRTVLAAASKKAGHRYLMDILQVL